MRVIPGNAQHIGDREGQEDAFGFSSLGDRAFERHAGVMLVLCDGMGGLANGAAASRAAVDAALSGYCRKQPSEDIPSALNRALCEAHQAVCTICGEGGNAGSTIVMAVVWQDKLYWASLGDSRLYLCREGAPAAQLTEDHNVASLLDQRVTRGEAVAKEGASASNPDALTAYLGAPYPPRPHTGRDVPLQLGDRIIACSDGLYRGLSPEAMAAIASHGDPMTAAERMIGSVLKQKLPHQDNLTVVLLEVSSHRRVIDIIGTARPTALAALCGAVGGFGAAVALAVVLFIFGFLTFGAPVAPPPAPPEKTDSATGAGREAAGSAGGSAPSDPTTGTTVDKPSTAPSGNGGAPPKSPRKATPPNE